MSGIIFALLLTQISTRDLLKPALIAILLVDLLSIGVSLIDVEKTEVVFSDNPVCRFIESQSHSELFRARDCVGAVPVTIASRFGIQKTDCYYPVLRYYKELRLGLQGEGLKTEEMSGLRLLNTKYIVAENRLDNEDLHLVYIAHNVSVFALWCGISNIPEVYVYELWGYLPRAFIVHRCLVQENQTKVLELLRNPDFDPRTTCYVSEGTCLNGSTALEEVEVVSYSADRIMLRTRTAERGILVTSEFFYPGWKVYVNDQGAGMIRVDGVLRGVFLGPGTHIVVFSYDPSSWCMGVSLSLVTCGILIIVLVFYLRKRLGPQESPVRTSR